MEVPEATASGTVTPHRLARVHGDPLLGELFPSLATGVHWDVDRIRAFLYETGSPHLSYPSIHIGGTNGKGSVASTLSSVLGAAGHRVGLYTSPHLCAFRERFRVGGSTASDADLRSIVDDFGPAVDAHGLTFFEAATALAFHLFARAGIDIAVLEVGLGGRLDATNVVTPLVTAVTNVAMDHAEYLGDSLEAIAVEKAGIVKPGVPFLTAEDDPAVLSVFRRVTDDLGAPMTVVALAGDAELEIDEAHTEFSIATEAWGELRLNTPLVGRHQALNTVLAIRVLEALGAELRPTRVQVEEGVGGVRWPGRTQIEHLEGTTWLFDVAHNPAGIAALVEVLELLRLPGPHVILIGVLGDKDWRSMLPPLFQQVEAVVLTQPPSAPVARRWNPEQVLDEVGSVEVLVEIESDFEVALERAGALAGEGTVIVTGSNHTVGDALCTLGLEPHQCPE
jgi:dihydrofolate synthase/folylpolyglutamate synthase